MLQQEQEEQEHISILDCETGRVRRGYAQPVGAKSESPLLYPPMSPPMTRISVPAESPNSTELAEPEENIKLDPSACDNYYVLEHKPLPKKIIGTSSLGRKMAADSPLASPQSPCNSCRSPSQFPKTNGSLYESLSLGRRCHCDKRSNSAASAATSKSVRPSVTSEDSSVSLPSPVWTNAYDSFDDPLSVSRRSFRSNSDLSVISSGPTSPFGPEASISTASDYSR